MDDELIEFKHTTDFEQGGIDTSISALTSV